MKLDTKIKKVLVSIIALPVLLLGLGVARVHRDESMWSAAADGDVATIERMMLFGASPDITFESGLTALQVSVYNGQFKAAKRLIERGADVERVTPDGDDLMTLAQSSEMRELIRIHRRAG